MKAPTKIISQFLISLGSSVILSLACILNAQSQQWISNTTTLPSGAALYTLNSSATTNDGRVGIGYTATGTPVGLLHVKPVTVSSVPLYSALFEGQVAIGSYFSSTPTSSDYLNVFGGVRVTGSLAAGKFANASETFTTGALRLGTNGSTYSWLQSYKTNSTYSPLVLNALGGGVGIGTTSVNATLDILSNQSAGLQISDAVGLSTLNIGVVFGGGNYANGTNQGDMVIRAIGSTASRLFITNNGGTNTPTAERIVFATGSSGANDVICMRIMQNGVIGIGTVLTPALINKASGYGLIVSGGIMTQNINVAVRTDVNWRDYVFNDDYPLKSLKELEKYISIHKHLPGIPSAEEVVKEGINLGKMDANLLEKVEELTLLMIKLKKENDRLSKFMDQIEKEKQGIKN